MALHSIYALCEPDTKQPRYVGRTSFPLGHRLSNHVASAKRGMSSEGLSLWVNQLEAIGKRPVIILLEECAPEDADKTEVAWITQYQQRGYALLNIAHLPRPPKTPRDRKPGQLTPGNIKMVGMPVSLHARLKAEAQRQHLTIYELVELLEDKASRYDAMKAALSSNGDDHESA